MSSTAHADSVFALVDCNSFYASCECVFAPHLWKRPVVVLSNNDGCVIARSKQAKLLGIPMGAPAFQFKEQFKKNGVYVCSSNYTLYGDISQRIMSILSHFTSDLQVYSIDEAFLALNTSNALEVARAIKQQIYQWIGVPVSIGIGPTKTLAKAANHFAKNDPASNGIASAIDKQAQKKLLSSFPVKEVWGIGRQLAAFLKSQGIYTAEELCQCDDLWIKKHLTVVGLRTVWELRGTPCLNIEEVEPPKKSIMSSKSFGRTITVYEELCEAISSYTTYAAAKLRKQQSLTAYIHVFLMTNRFSENDSYNNGVQIFLPEPTDYTPTLIQYAKQGLENIFKEGLRYKKAGILLGGLIPRHAFHPDLFNKSFKQQEKQKSLMEVLDNIQHKYGRNVIRIAAEGIQQPWQMKRALLSPSYTTRWNEILTIKID